MELILQRYKSNGDTTIGKLLVDFDYFCDTLEDENRNVKVKGETRIPAGTYKIRKRKVLSGLTKKYRNRFKWFDYHYELQKVPNFKYVYIHVGNYDEHTDGCILVGEHDGKNWAVWNSAKTFEKLYKKMNDADNITITIQDEF